MFIYLTSTKTTDKKLFSIKHEIFVNEVLKLTIKYSNIFAKIKKKT